LLGIFNKKSKKKN